MEGAPCATAACACIIACAKACACACTCSACWRACAARLRSFSTRQMIVAPTTDQTTIIAGEVERLLLGGPLAPVVAEVVHSPFIEVTLSNGSVIMARSAGDNGKNLRGRAAHRVIVDEAAFVPEGVIAEVIVPMLADTAGQLELISTPFGRNHFFEAYMRGQGRRPVLHLLSVPVSFKPAHQPRVH
jgi:hypothetical protein